MCALVMDMPKETASEGKQLVLNCLGITMGFMVIEIVNIRNLFSIANSKGIKIKN